MKQRPRAQSIPRASLSRRAFCMHFSFYTHCFDDALLRVRQLLPDQDLPWFVDTFLGCWKHPLPKDLNTRCKCKPYTKQRCVVGSLHICSSHCQSMDLSGLIHSPRGASAPPTISHLIWAGMGSLCAAGYLRAHGSWRSGKVDISLSTISMAQCGTQGFLSK